jgi:ubiquinone/menaquinone biosynthesis C-methylase UbiE
VPESAHGDATVGGQTPEMGAPGWLGRVGQIYGGADHASIEAVLDRSLDPLGPDVLFDMVGELGLGPGSMVVDVGARDGAQMIELQRRFGCAAIGIEPLTANLGRVDAGTGHPPLMVCAVGEAMPLRDDVADLVWVRDMLVHVPDLGAMLAEIARVAKPGAAVLVFAVFATDRLDPAEAAELYGPLAIVAANMERANLERAATHAALAIERHVRLDGQWREHGEEHDVGRTSRQLLRVARMRRDPDRYRAALGAQEYAIELGDSLYGIYQMLGKLSASIYVLRSSGRRPSSTRP